MEKEKVTEELVRQNGNQAAAVMADYAGQSDGGGSTGGASGVVIQDGSIVNSAPFRAATEEDVAKFTDGGVGVGVPVVEINGVVPYALQHSENGGYADVFLLTTLDLTEHAAYYVRNGVTSFGADARFRVMVLLISDDATLLAVQMAE